MSDAQTTLIDQLQSTYLTGLHSDVTICIQTSTNIKKYFLHKYILALRCPYFKTLFEDGKNSYIIPFTVSQILFEKILQWIYSAQILISLDTVFPLQKIAQQLDLLEIQHECKKFIKQKLEGDDFVELYLCATKYNEKEVMQQCLEAMENNFLVTMNSNAFCELPITVIQHLLQSEDVNSTEIDLFFGLMKWWRANEENHDKKEFDSMLTCIRFPIMTPQQLGSVQKLNIVPDELLLEAFRYHACLGLGLDDHKFRHRLAFQHFWWDKNFCGEDIEIIGDRKMTCTISKPNVCRYQIVLGTKLFTDGVYYWEITIDDCSNYSHIMIGVMANSPELTPEKLNSTWLGSDAYGYSWFGFNGTKYHESMSPSYDGNTFGKGDVIGVKLDLQARTLGFYKNGKYLGTAFRLKQKEFYAAVSLRQTGDKITLSTSNFKYKM